MTTEIGREGHVTLRWASIKGLEKKNKFFESTNLIRNSPLCLKVGYVGEKEVSYGPMHPVCEEWLAYGL